MVFVPQGESEDAVKPRDAGFAPLLVSVDDDLRIRFGLEDMPLGQELGAQLDEVVNLAVDPTGSFRNRPDPGGGWRTSSPRSRHDRRALR